MQEDDHATKTVHYAEEPRLDAAAILERAALPADEAAIVMSSGRRYAIKAGEDADRLVVRGRGGDVVLRIQITDRGPVLSFAGAEIVVEAARTIELSADTIALRARGDMTVEVGGDRHARIGGDERVEASRVELQANDAGLSLKAMEAIRLDGEHIGLNDDPSPRPFGWSSIADEDA